MAGCISCVVLPILLFLFHRYLQPILLKFWNPWSVKEDKSEGQNGYVCPLKKCIEDKEKIMEFEQHTADSQRLKSE